MNNSPERRDQGAVRDSVVAIVVHHKSYDTIGLTVHGLVDQGIRNDRMVIVDNSEQANQRGALMASLPPGTRVIFVDNDGYAAAVNSGLAYLREVGISSQYTLVSTHEVRLEAGAVAILVEALAADATAGAAGPTLVALGSEENAQVFSQGGYLSRFLRIPRHCRVVQAGGRRDHLPQIVQRDWLDGALVLFDSEVLAAHPLRTEFFLYLEEVEQQARIRQSGFKVLFVPAAVASQSTNGAPAYWFARNLHVFQRLHGSLLTVVLTTPIWILAHVVRREQGRRWAFLRDAGRGWVEGITACVPGAVALPCKETPAQSSSHQRNI